MRIHRNLIVAALAIVLGATIGAGAILAIAGGGSSGQAPAASDSHDPRGDGAVVDGRTIEAVDSESQPGRAPNSPSGIPTKPHEPAGQGEEVVDGDEEPMPGDEDEPTDPIGEVTPGLVPDEQVLAALPGTPKPEPNSDLADGPSSFAAAPSCSNQCIASGVAYPRGFGSELVVTTKVPATVFVGVVADTNGDGTYDVTEATSTAWGVAEYVTEFSWALDHLAPGQLHHVTVAATDKDGHTSHAYGTFTTLSKRHVQLMVNPVILTGGTGSVLPGSMLLRAAGEDYGVPEYEGANSWYDVDWYEVGTWRTYGDVERHLDVDLLIRRSIGGDICEATWPNHSTPQGHYKPGCLAWNTASASVDLDQVPDGKAAWSSHSFAATLNTPTSGDGALPPGYGDPHHFHATAPMVVLVSYS